MKVKRIIVAIMLVVLLGTPFLSTVNASTDTEAPIINNVLIKDYDVNHTYTAEEIVKVKIDATDNMQIYYAFVVIKNTETLQEYEYCFNATVVEIYDELIVEIPISELQSGTYEVVRVTVNDANGNSAIKHKADIEQNTIRVDNSAYGQDVNRPHIKSVVVTPSEGDSVETNFTYKAIIVAGASEITNVGMSFKHVNNSLWGFRMTKTDNTDEYELVVNAHRDFQGNYIDTIVFESMNINVASGESYMLYPESDWQTEHGLLAIEGVKQGDLDIKLTDIEKDTDLPILEKFEYESSIIYTPDDMILYVTATDNTAGLSTVSATVFEEDEEGNYDVIANTGFIGWFEGESGEKQTATCESNFPRYHDGGRYYIREIILTDKAGNTSTYSVDNGDFEKRYFKVENRNTYDYMTSTSAPDFLDVIRQASFEDEKTVVAHVDRAKSVVPKEFFEIIAGKKVTVIFEKVYNTHAGSDYTDDGLQWIMYGKDINKNKAKDIDVYFYIETAYDRSYWDKQLERHNGVDPNESELVEGSDAKIREAMLESGWDDVVKHIEKLQKPNESFLDAYSRICYTPYVRMVFADNGELPGKTTIRFKPSYSMRYWSDDQLLKVFYKNDKNGKFDLVHDKIAKHEEGYYEFTIHHNSEYAFTDEFYDVEDVTTNSNVTNNGTIEKVPQTGDGSNTTLWILLLGMASVLMVYSSKQKMRGIKNVNK